MARRRDVFATGEVLARIASFQVCVLKIILEEIKIGPLWKIKETNDRKFMAFFHIYIYIYIYHTIK
jgi:hypothetical protein